MWDFLVQNAWIILFIGVMFFMHARGLSHGGGCCGGGHSHGRHQYRPRQNEENTNPAPTKEGKVHSH